MVYGLPCDYALLKLGQFAEFESGYSECLAGERNEKILSMDPGRNDPFQQKGPDNICGFFPENAS